MPQMLDDITTRQWDNTQVPHYFPYMGKTISLLDEHRFPIKESVFG